MPKLIPEAPSPLAVQLRPWTATITTVNPFSAALVLHHQTHGLSSIPCRSLRQLNYLHSRQFIWRSWDANADWPSDVAKLLHIYAASCRSIELTRWLARL